MDTSVQDELPLTVDHNYVMFVKQIKAESKLMSNVPVPPHILSCLPLIPFKKVMSSFAFEN